MIKAIRFRASEIEAWVNNNGNPAGGLEVKPVQFELRLAAGEDRTVGGPAVESKATEGVRE